MEEAKVSKVSRLRIYQKLSCKNDKNNALKAGREQNEIQCLSNDSYRF